MSKHSSAVSDGSVQAAPEAAVKEGESSNNLLFGPSDSALARQVFKSSGERSSAESSSALSALPNVEFVDSEVPHRYLISPIEIPGRISPKPNTGNSEVNISDLPDSRGSVPPIIDTAALRESLEGLDLTKSPHTKMVPDGPGGISPGHIDIPTTVRTDFNAKPLTGIHDLVTKDPREEIAAKSTEKAVEDGASKLDPVSVGEMKHLDYLQKTNPELYDMLINQFKFGGSVDSDDADEDSGSRDIPD